MEKDKSEETERIKSLGLIGLPERVLLFNERQALKGNPEKELLFQLNSCIIIN